MRRDGVRSKQDGASCLRPVKLRTDQRKNAHSVWMALEVEPLWETVLPFRSPLNEEGRTPPCGWCGWAEFLSFSSVIVNSFWSHRGAKTRTNWSLFQVYRVLFEAIYSIKITMAALDDGDDVSFVDWSQFYIYLEEVNGRDTTVYSATDGTDPCEWISWAVCNDKTKLPETWCSREPINGGRFCRDKHQLWAALKWRRSSLGSSARCWIFIMLWRHHLCCHLERF